MAPKTCKMCRAAKPLDQFGRDARNRDGFKGECKACENERVRAWRAANDGGKYQAHRAKARERAAEFYEANREQCAQKDARWRKVNRARKAAKDKAYQHVNRARLNAMAALWRIANRDRVNAAQRARAPRYAATKAATVAFRRAALLRATPAWADRGAIKAVYRRARDLQQRSGIRMHVDHFIPLVHPLVCGLHVEANLRVVPAAVNQSKSNRFDGA